MTLQLIPPLLLWGTAFSATVIGTLYALWRISKRPVLTNEPFPISILKPLKGAEPALEACLESFFRLQYPCYEIFFAVADRHDPACKVVQRLIRKYPQINAELIIGDVDIGPNPKINNLVIPYHKAKYDLILISDSNVRVEPNYLQNILPHLGPGVGVVTAAVAGVNPSGVGAQLEAMYLNTFYMRWMHLATALGFPMVVGKSMLFRRSTAERFGGIENLARYLAEDYMTGCAMQRLGLKTVVMPQPIRQHIGEYSFKNFWTRHLRWGRIRKAHGPIAFLFEPFFGPFVSGFLGAISFHSWLGIPIGTFFMLHIAVWLTMDLLLIRKLGSRISFSTGLTWFLRELLSLPHWFHIAAGNSILWRGTRLKLLPGGLLANF